MNLLPCPVCGEKVGEPYKVGGGDERSGYNFAMVIGCKCGVTMSKSSHTTLNGWCDDRGQALTEVFSAWNTRADHPDTKRLDWLLKYFTFRPNLINNNCRNPYVRIFEPDRLELIFKLQDAYEQIDSDDPRDIIDKAMEDE